MSLLHGPSMAYAESVADSYPQIISHHMGGDHHHHTGLAADDSQTAPDRDGATGKAVPNCPLANLAAVAPSAPAAISGGEGAKIVLLRQSPLMSADAGAIDPPPRSPA